VVTNSHAATAIAAAVVTNPSAGASSDYRPIAGGRSNGPAGDIFKPAGAFWKNNFARNALQNM
jgi:hypothetical protein